MDTVMLDVMLDMNRTVPSGEPNPITNLIYTNLDEKIREAIRTYNGMLPIVLMPGTMDIIGYVTSIDDKTAHCKLADDGISLLKKGLLEGKTIQFYGYTRNHSCKTEDGTGTVNGIVVAALSQGGILGDNIITIGKSKREEKL